MYFWNPIPSYVTGANLATFGSSFDPIGSDIAGNTAAIALQNPQTWAASSAVGQLQAQDWINSLVFSGSFGASSFDPLISIGNIVSWAQSPLL